MINGDYILVVAPDDYPGVRYREKYCYEHYLVYWQEYGVLPNKDEIIHHIDGDKHNNVPQNLQLMKRKEHIVLHNTARLTSLVILKCVGCQKIFIRERNKTFLSKGGTYTCCCRRCIGIATSLKTSNPLEFNKRIAENVIKEFKDNKDKYLL